MDGCAGARPGHLLHRSARLEPRAGARAGHLRGHHRGAGGAAGEDGSQRAAGHDAAGAERHVERGARAGGLRQCHGLAGVHGVSVFARGDADGIRQPGGLPVHRTLRPHAIASGVFAGGGGPGAGAVHPVGHGARRWGGVPDYALGGGGLRVGAGTHGAQNRLVPGAGQLPHDLCGVGDVSDGHGGESADRGVRAQARECGVDLGTLAGRVVPAGLSDARHRAAGCCSAW